MAVGAQVGNVSSNPVYMISQSSSYPEFNNNNNRVQNTFLNPSNAKLHANIWGIHRCISIN